jgi:hypothetical protein
MLPELLEERRRTRFGRPDDEEVGYRSVSPRGQLTQPTNESDAARLEQLRVSHGNRICVDVRGAIAHNGCVPMAESGDRRQRQCRSPSAEFLPEGTGAAD